MYLGLHSPQSWCVSCWTLPYCVSPLCQHEAKSSSSVSKDSMYFFPSSKPLWHIWTGSPLLFTCTRYWGLWVPSSLNDKTFGIGYLIHINDAFCKCVLGEMGDGIGSLHANTPLSVSMLTWNMGWNNYCYKFIVFLENLPCTKHVFYVYVYVYKYTYICVYVLHNLKIVGSKHHTLRTNRRRTVQLQSIRHEIHVFP